MLIEKMLHNSANVMTKQKQEDNIPGYRCSPQGDRGPGEALHRPAVQEGQKIKGKRGEIELMFHPSAMWPAPRGRDPPRTRKIFLTGDVLFEHLRTLKARTFPSGTSTR